MGAAVLLLRRVMRKQQRRVDAELRAAEEAMDRRKPDQGVPLEQDPVTGVYRPKKMR